MKTVCGYSINWEATGSMLSAGAAWAGVIALVWATLKGANVFKDWKRQKVEERRMDLAEHVLIHAYKLHVGFLTMRVPFRSLAETEKAKQQLHDEQLLTDGTHPDLARLILEGRICANRYRQNEPSINELRALMPRVKAIFGGDVEEAAARVLNLYSQYLWCANSLHLAFEHGGKEAEDEYMRSLRITLDVSGEDPAAADMDRQIEALDNELLPIIREG